MLSGQPEANSTEYASPQMDSSDEVQLPSQQEGKRIVTVEECGRIIGKIISPVEGDVFGPWQGAVYLTRD